MSEEYEAGMILNESLLIRMAYLFDDSKKPTIKSHTDTCPYCSMPIDSHDRFCHFCGINLNYNPEEMFESLVNTFNESDNELSEDIRYVAYKFLKMILEGIELEYAIMTCENAYNLSGNLLMKYLDENNYLKGNEITDEGHDFLRKHPLHLFEKYELDAFDYSDFERYFYENENLDDKKIVLSYLEQFSDDDAGDLKKEIKNGN